MKDSPVWIWTHEVALREADGVGAALRIADVPALVALDGCEGAELLRSSAEPGMSTARFTVLIRWRSPDVRPPSSRLPGLMGTAGSVSVHRPAGEPTVDVELGADSHPAVSSHSVAPEPAAWPRRRKVTTVAGLVLVAVGLAWFGRSHGSDDDSAPTVPPATSLAPAASSPPIERNFVPWPEPPRDHDPHVSGRPGPGTPVVPGGDGRTLVYVNDRRRPTVVDLATGDQLELDFAETRATDVFLVENGEVVVTDELDSELPLGSERAFLFLVVIDAAGPPNDERPAPTLCLDAAGSCRDRAWTEGRFGDPRFHVASVAGDPVAVLGDLLGAGGSTSGDRWTTFDSVEGDGAAVRVPTPAPHAVVWVVTQPV